MGAGMKLATSQLELLDSVVYRFLIFFGYHSFLSEYLLQGPYGYASF